MEKWETFSKNDLQKIVDRLDKAEVEGSNPSCGTNKFFGLAVAN